jgi:hypothetical protein
LMSKSATVRDIFLVNCVAPFALSLYFLPDLMKAHHPRLVLISSSSHIRGRAYKKNDLIEYLRDYSNDKILQVYADSKLNSIRLSRALHRRLNGTGVTVQNIHPGLVDTPMLRGYLPWFIDPLHRLLLSPQEAAVGILAAITSSVAFYSVGAQPSIHRLSPTVLHEMATIEEDILFKDAVESLPYPFVMNVVRRLRAFEQTDCPEVQLKRLRSKALSEIAKEIELILHK